GDASVTTRCPEQSRKVFVPNKLLECLPPSSSLPNERLRWNTNEEIASFLISFERHEEWLSCSLKTRPKNGSIVLYNRKKVKYRKDGYCWKKRKDGKTTREDHMKLKVQGMEGHLGTAGVSWGQPGTAGVSWGRRGQRSLFRTQGVKPGAEWRSSDLTCRVRGQGVL
uniref:Calmodulin binding transcription activator 2 n=1 Tax=Salarias fasciatus TaxID=181472 RepID=A0A672FFP4_SALFA